MSVAWLTSVIDWDTCKLQYEVLGDSLERVAATHNLPIASLQRIAEEEGWQQIDPESMSLTDMTSYLVEVRRSLQIKLDLATLYREIELFPQVISIEDSLIDKIRSTINNIDTTDPRAAGALRALGQSLHSIAERKGKYTEDDALVDDDTNFTVEIVRATERGENVKSIPAHKRINASD